MEQQPGSVLAERQFEPLEAILQAYEPRLKPLETLEERCIEYPNLAMEARQLQIYQRLIKVAQALDQLIKKVPSSHIEPKKETHTKEGEQQEELDKENQENEGKESLSQGVEIWDVLAPKLLSNASILKVDEDWVNKL